MLVRHATVARAARLLASMKELAVQTEKAVTVRVGGGRTATLRYLAFAPAAYDTPNPSQPASKWPLLLFLHGAGERGERLELVKTHGPPQCVESQPDFPFLVISPQCPAGQRWQTDQLDQLLHQVVSQYRVDSERIYLTGLSMGGFGAWALAAAHPERFAAVAPICGGGEPAWAEQLQNTPLWVFHGENDAIVPPGRSTQMVEAVRAVGGKVRYTLYADVGHHSWTPAYKNPQLYEWMLQHKRPQSQ